MKVYKTKIAIAFCLWVLTACQLALIKPPVISESTPIPVTSVPSPTPTESNGTNQTRNGVSLTITNITFSKRNTIVEFKIQIGPEWGLEIKEFQPQLVNLSNSILIGKTEKHYSELSTWMTFPQPDPQTGGIQFAGGITFPPVENGTVSFQTEIEINEIPIPEPVTISIGNHELVHPWPICKSFSFNGFKDVSGKVSLLYQGASQVQLEFSFDRVTSGGLELGCIWFYPEKQESIKENRCHTNEKQAICTLRFDSGANQALPILLHASASITIIEPFVISWPIENKIEDVVGYLRLG